MSSKKEFLGVLKIELDNDDNRRVYVHKKGSSIYLDEILVHPSNERSQEGWIKEYELCRNVQVKNWRFVPPHLLKLENEL